MTKSNISSLYHYWRNISLIFIPVIGLLGLALRGVGRIGFSFNYQFMLHAHSHVALLGWVYFGAVCLLIKYFGTNERAKIYHWNLLVTLVTVIGMLASFPFQGYGAFSITFSSLFLVCSYHLSFHLLKDLKSQAKPGASLVRWAILFLVISSIGPWSLGPIMKSGVEPSVYLNAIYFYLHFLYNGFFVFALLGISAAHLNWHNQLYKPKNHQIFAALLGLACVLTFALSLTWAYPFTFFFIIGGIGAVLQLVLVVLYIPWKRVKEIAVIKAIVPMLKTAAICFLLKNILQVLSALPLFAYWIAQGRNLVIGYLHLVFLGIFTPFILAMLYRKTQNNNLLKLGFSFYLIGFVFTEVWLFITGIARISQSESLLFSFWPMMLLSGLLLFGLVLLCISLWLQKAEKSA